MEEMILGTLSPNNRLIESPMANRVTVMAQIRSGSEDSCDGDHQGQLHPSDYQHPVLSPSSRGQSTTGGAVTGWCTVIRHDSATEKRDNMDGF